MHMYFERGRAYKMLILFVALWATLAIAVGALNKADVELGSSLNGTDIVLALKMCAVIFTVVAAGVGGVACKVYRLLPVPCVQIRRYEPPRLVDRSRAPPHGFSLLRALRIIIV